LTLHSKFISTVAKKKIKHRNAYSETLLRTKKKKHHKVNQELNQKRELMMMMMMIW